MLSLEQAVGFADAFSEHQLARAVTRFDRLLYRGFDCNEAFVVATAELIAIARDLVREPLVSGGVCSTQPTAREGGDADENAFRPSRTRFSVLGCFILTGAAVLAAFSGMAPMGYLIGVTKRSWPQRS